MPTMMRAQENPFRPKDEGIAQDMFNLIFGSNPQEEMMVSLGPSMAGLGRGAGMVAPKIPGMPTPKPIAAPPGMNTPEGAQAARDALMGEYDRLLKELGSRYQPPGTQGRLPGVF